MTKIEELNIEWIGICNMMQILNKQRQEVYVKWKAEMEREGHSFGEDFPVRIDWEPTFYADLFGNNIRIDKSE